MKVAALGIGAGAVAFVVVSLVSIWAYNSGIDPALPAVVVLLVAVGAVVPCVAFSRVGVVAGVTMLLLFALGMMLGRTPSLVAEVNYDVPAIIAHGGRSGIVAALVGATLAASGMSLSAERRREAASAGRAAVER